MKDYFGKGHYVKYLGCITQEKFEELYNEMSNSKDKLPVASTIHPFDNTRVNAWIFYETAPGTDTGKTTVIKEETKKPIKMGM